MTRKTTKPRGAKPRNGKRVAKATPAAPSIVARLDSQSRDVREILTMLTYRRSMDSPGERAFITRWIDGLALPNGATRSIDGAGNRWVVVPGPGAERVLFSTHTDTVHHRDSKRYQGPQRVLYDADRMLAMKVDDQPLGADDGAGVWIALEMIRASVPGSYVFHRGEERGGIGSGWIRDNAAIPMTVDYAIAFDRRGTHDVITHQAMGRCCSDTFASALCDALGMAHRPSDEGIFTDTAHYVDDVPECTNISTGYEREHSPQETQDVRYLLELRAAAIAAPWNELPVERKPGDDGANEGFNWSRLDMEPLRGARVPLFDSWDACYRLAEEDPDEAAELLWEAYGNDGGR